MKDTSPVSSGYGHRPPSKKRQWTTWLYLVLFGVFVGVGASRQFGTTEPERPAPGGAGGTAQAQTAPAVTPASELAYERALINATRKAMPAVVSVHVTGQQLLRIRDPFLEMLYGPMVRRRNISGMGSGVIIDPAGIIITNDHVVRVGENADVSYTVVLTNGDSYEATLLHQLPVHDIAILSIEADGLPHLELGDSDPVTPGQTVLAVGNPFGNTITGGLLGSEPTVTRGIISARHRTLTISDGAVTHYYRELLQTDASINRGNSGGALVDINGELIGINTAIYTAGGTGSIGIGFAIPSNRVALMLDRIEQYGEVGQSYSGIRVQDLTGQMAEALDFTERGGAIVVEVQPGSPGDEAGVRRGDIITGVNGFSVTSADELVTVFQGSMPGEVFTLQVYRNNALRSLTLELGSQ